MATMIERIEKQIQKLTETAKKFEEAADALDNEWIEVQVLELEMEKKARAIRTKMERLDNRSEKLRVKQYNAEDKLASLNQTLAAFLNPRKTDYDEVCALCGK